MEQASQYVSNNGGLISTVFFIVFALVILYVVYTYLYPADDPSYVEFIKHEVDARRPPIVLKKNGKAPPIFTGGEFTLSFWIYVDDWNYSVSNYKPLFNLGPAITSANTQSVLVGMLTPFKNGLVVRAGTVSPNGAPGTPSPSSDATPDITILSTRNALMQKKISMNMFESTVDTPCDVKEVPLQRWVNVTIVSAGRVLDVYMNGKLSRSCVLDNVVRVPRGDIFLSLGQFGGRFSSVQMWNQQVTPDVIYGIYMMGPTQTQQDIFTDVAKYLGLNVSFTGSAPGQPIPSANPNPFADVNAEASALTCGAVSGLGTELGSLYNSASSSASSAYNTAADTTSSLYHRM
jgi:hypothetical protein